MASDDGTIVSEMPLEPAKSKNKAKHKQRYRKQWEIQEAFRGKLAIFPLMYFSK